jgi:hypothetical protein
MFKTASTSTPTIKVSPVISSAVVSFSNQRKQKFEFGWGDSFLSQKTRQWIPPNGAVKIEFKDSKGNIINAVSSAVKK